MTKEEMEQLSNQALVSVHQLDDAALASLLDRIAISRGCAHMLYEPGVGWRTREEIWRELTGEDE